MIPPSIMAAIGLFLALGLVPFSAGWLRTAGWLMVAVGLLLSAAVAWQGRLPRLGYAEGFLLVHLTGERPERVPVEAVECFFLGTGSWQMLGKHGHELPIRNLVVRLAERATEFHERSVKSTLGTWEGGYITIHGAWCEPLTLELVNRLNARLSQVHRTTADVTGEGNP
jgi:hypothetical protein